MKASINGVIVEGSAVEIRELLGLPVCKPIEQPVEQVKPVVERQRKLVEVAYTPKSRQVSMNRRWWSKEDKATLMQFWQPGRSKAKRKANKAVAKLLGRKYGSCSQAYGKIKRRG